jgi:hypothetical protein
VIKVFEDLVINKQNEYLILLSDKDRELDDLKRENGLLKDTLHLTKGDRVKDHQFINQLQNEIGFMSSRMDLLTETNVKGKADKSSNETVSFDKRSIHVRVLFLKI